MPGYEYGDPDLESNVLAVALDVYDCLSRLDGRIGDLDARHGRRLAVAGGAIMCEGLVLHCVGGAARLELRAGVDSRLVNARWLAAVDDLRISAARLAKMRGAVQGELWIADHLRRAPALSPDQRIRLARLLGLVEDQHGKVST